MKFTKQQSKAIKLRNKNILVSAAAGSGKTAVLVNRIISRVLDDENPIDIDRILVMTFTKAAASQMRDRILKAIEEKRREKPLDKNLQKQAALVHSSNIMTIDSFCLAVVRNHFSEIGLNPDFRMADEGECNLLKRDVLTSVLEEFYRDGNDEFLNMTETFASGKSDDSLDELILKLHRFSESYPDPEKWLEDCYKAYEDLSVDNMSEYQWVKDYIEDVKGSLNSIRRQLDLACDVCTEEYGPKPYLEALESDISYIDRIMSKQTYSEIYEYLTENGTYEPVKLGTYRMPKGEDVTEDEIIKRTALKEKVQDVRKKAKEIITDIDAYIAANSPESICEGMAVMLPVVRKLVQVTKAFGDAFDKKKREKNVVDFNDLEHMCLDILRKSESTAEEYRQFFEEIYVDEYQDSNLVQEEILSYLCRKEDSSGNLFMVGDVKQSIYGFRLARPEIFIDKYNRYPEEADNSGDIRIDLHDNFRSRTTVIESANDIFRHVMTEETGKIIYDDNAALHAMAEFDEGEGYETELILSIKDEDIPDKELEALSVASKIKEIVGKLDVKDEEGFVRKARYSDIVILLRTAKGWDNVFMNTLSSSGIPVHVTSSSGYFSQPEVAVLLEFLKIIDNPLQDIPLMSVLRSQIGNMTDEEVAIIRGAFHQGYLFESLIQYAETYEKSKETTVIINKINSFIEELNHYRNKMAYTSVDRIIEEIIDGYYGQNIAASKNGKKKYANLNVLLNKAIDYGKTSFKGLFHFNRYIEMLHKYEVDFGEASVLDEKDNAVRIMSIHKSKGLEFPVCFLAGMGKKFNFMDANDQVITDADRGIGVDVINLDKRTRVKSLYKKALSIKKRNEALAEELRLFYVAMTRAKEKLIMTSTVKDDADIDSYVSLRKASSYLDLYKYAVSCHNIESIILKTNNIEDLMLSEIKDTVILEKERALIDRILSNQDAKLPEEVVKRMNYVYPYEKEKTAVKVSVSELKRRSMEIKDLGSTDDLEAEKTLIAVPDPIIPDFMNDEKEKFSPTLRGTAIHRIFELWDYNLDNDFNNIEGFVERVHEDKRLEDDLYPYINKYIIRDFLNSEVALRMKKAFESGSLRREQPFVIEDEDTGLLIQGIIDAYFIEDDEIVVVDYKTDRVGTEQELVDKYKVQLEYYAKALSMLLNKKIREMVIYSTYLKTSITM